MGTSITEERKLYAALNNCAFVSTKTLKEDYSKPFCFLMDASMLGVGVGFDTKGAGKIDVVKPEGSPELIQVDDSREGWVEAITCLVDSYLDEGSLPVEVDVANVRPYGAPIN
jgi:hypothetical protein